MTYGRQQLLWQKQVTVVGSIDLDSQIEEYHAGVAQFQHAVCHRRTERRQRYRCRSLLQQSVILLIFGVANVIAFIIELIEDNNIQQLF